jgi:hypothetical protein
LEPHTQSDRTAAPAIDTTAEPANLTDRMARHQTPDTPYDLRRGHYELGMDAPHALRIAAAFTELARAI